MLRFMFVLLCLLTTGGCAFFLPVSYTQVPVRSAHMAYSGPQYLPASADALSFQATDVINRMRLSHGRTTLKPDARLDQAAAIHASDLAAHGTFSHEGSDGSQVMHRSRRVGYNYCFIAENLAKGTWTLQASLEGWLASPGHRENLLATDATQFGLVRGPGNLWVMVLGKPGC